LTDRILTQDELKSKLRYNPETGVFRKVNVNKIVGSLNHHGYMHISINKKVYQLHRLAWLYVYGEIPAEQIDHINGIRNDNRICNLRKANRHENCRNSGLRRDNNSGYKGVGWHKGCNKWQARCVIDGKRKHIGMYDSAELAAAAYQEYAKKSYGEFHRAT
jgi:hypothetical protein